MNDAAGTLWPAYCHSRSSCTRNRGCMYTNCKHEGQDIGPAIDAVIADPSKGFSTSKRGAIARALMEQFHNPDESWFVPEDEYEASKFLVKCADAILAVRLDEAAIRKDEREKCAKVAEWEGYATTGRQIAQAIRNGGKQP